MTRANQSQIVEEKEVERWTLKLILPHVGLVFVLFTYILFGAIVFYLIESPTENNIRETIQGNVEEAQKALAQELWELAEDTEIKSKEEFDQKANVKIDAYIAKLYDDTFPSTYASSGFVKNPQKVWTFPTACLFAVTLVTTVGYGTPAPISKTGRIFCVLFGLVGIPLTLVTIADLAKFLGTFLQRQYTNFRNRFKKRKPQQRRRGVMPTEVIEDLEVPIFWLFSMLLLYPVIGAFCLNQWEGWPYLDCFYFCFISVFTVGYGDFVPANESYYVLTILFILMGLIITTICIDLVGSQCIDKVHFFGRKLGAARLALSQMAMGFMGVMGLLGKNTVAVKPYDPNGHRIHFADGLHWQNYIKKVIDLHSPDMSEISDDDLIFM